MKQILAILTVVFIVVILPEVVLPFFLRKANEHGQEVMLERMRQEAVEHHKAEWFTNEAGKQVWRWLP